MALTAAGLAFLAATLGDTGDSAHADYELGTLAGYVGLATVAGLVLVPLARLRPRDGIFLAVAAGLLWGGSDVTIKALSGHTDLGIAVIVHPFAFVILILSLVGLLVSARSLQLGPVVPVITVTSATANIFTIAAGPIVFGEPMPDDALGVALRLLAFALVIGAAALTPPPVPETLPAAAPGPGPRARGMNALFEPVDGAPDRVRATPLTRGPWDPKAQHGGAPAALLGRAIERVEPGADMPVVRLTFELVRPVPVGELRVEAELVRPGRRVQLVAARLFAGEQLVMQAFALRMRRAPGAVPPVAAGAPPVPRSRVSRPGRPWRPRTADRASPTAAWSCASPRAATSSAAAPSSGSACACRWSPARSPARCAAPSPPRTSATACRPCSTGTSTCSSTRTSRCTWSASRPGNGSRSTPRRRSPATAPGSPRGAARRARPHRRRAAVAVRRRPPA